MTDRGGKHRQSLFVFGLWAVYTLYLHPLAGFPGPRWATISPVSLSI